jgi:hypothetical protein
MIKQKRQLIRQAAKDGEEIKMRIADSQDIMESLSMKVDGSVNFR